MKKSKKGTSKAKSLKCLKEKTEAYFKEEKYKEALLSSEDIIKAYPKNIYGYLGVIKAKTQNYNYYLNDEDLKTLKKTYDEALLVANKKDKETLSREFCEYSYDCKEVENLRRIKREITGKELLRIVHLSSITFISQNVTVANGYNVDGKKIANIYDFINGLFLLGCLIFNLFNHNYLLLLTIPFGIFGIINIYSFINVNFFKKGKVRSERRKVKKLIDAADKRILNLKEQIKKLDDNLTFLYDQKASIILKIPESFGEQIKEELDCYEKKNASGIFEQLLNNNAYPFVEELSVKTTLSVDDIELVVKENLEKEDDELSRFISDKTAERKNKQSELLYMKKITIFNVVFTILLLIISVSSMVVLINNFYEINYMSFVIACVIGVISTLIYNINNGKHRTLMDTFNDNLLSCIFSATLIYDLVYSSITSELKVTYGFVQMPLIFLLIFIGFVMLTSLFKYDHFLKKLRR